MKPLDMSQVLYSWLHSQLEGIHTTIPAIVESYDRTTRKAKVLPAINLLCATGISIPYKPIVDVQVIMAGGANWDIDVELEKGDGGLLMFSEASIGNWLNSSGSESVDAEDSSRFSMQDAFFLPGVWPWGKIPTGRPSKGMLLRYKDSKIHLNDTKVTIQDKQGGKLEIDGGLLSLANSVSDMKTEMGKVWDAINDVLNKLAVVKPVYINTAGVPTPCVPDAILAPLIATSIASNTANKTAVGSLLK